MKGVTSMADMRELNLEQMEMATGGVLRQVNTGCSDKAQVRSSPTTGERNRQDSLVNGTMVDTVDDTLHFDDVSGRNFVKIRYTDKYNNQKEGWIAASMIGMKR